MVYMQLTIIIIMAKLQSQIQENNSHTYRENHGDQVFKYGKTKTNH